MAVDFTGTELELGDLVVYVSSGRYTTRIIAKVAKVMNFMVVLEGIEVDHRGDHAKYRVDSHNCFAVKEFKSGLTAENS